MYACICMCVFMSSNTLTHTYSVRVCLIMIKPVFSSLTNHKLLLSNKDYMEAHFACTNWTLEGYAARAT